MFWSVHTPLCRPFVAAVEENARQGEDTPSVVVVVVFARAVFVGELGLDEVASRLFRRLGATFSAALSVFALIVALGTWILGTPTPVARPLFIAAFLAVGLLMLPVALRLGDVSLTRASG